MHVKPPSGPRTRGIHGLSISVGLLSTVLALVLLELLVAAWTAVPGFQVPSCDPRFQDDGIHRFDSGMGWRLKPNLISPDDRTNSLGFRSTTEVPEGRTRILVLGDSMVYGAGVPVQNIFSELLNAQAPSYFVNTGHIGYSTGQEYLVLNEYFDSLRPALVVLFYTQANDQWTNVRGTDFYPRFEVDARGVLRHEPPRPVNDVSAYKCLHAYRLLDQTLLMGKDLHYLRHRTEYALLGRRSSSWIVAEAILDAISRYVKDRRVPLVVVDMPNVTDTTTTRSAAREQDLKRAVEARGHRYYNLLDFYPSDRRRLFLPDESHWNAAGHRFIAEHLGRWATEEVGGSGPDQQRPRRSSTQP